MKRRYLATGIQGQSEEAINCFVLIGIIVIPSLQVHRCRELKTQHVYAAKFIPIGHAMEKALIRKEIDIMNHLHHCKLINLHDAFEDEDEMVLIFEL